jgi:GNAT superfamily N-acetyltransferase
MAIAVRRATDEDAGTVAEFAIKLFSQHREYDADRFAKLDDVEGAAWFYASRIAGETSSVLVVKLDGAVVGFAYLEYEAMNYADLLEDAVWLHDLFVAETARRTGVGVELMKAALAEARRLRGQKLVLSVAAQNTAAMDFFKGLGFRTTMHEMTLELD